MTEPPVLQGKGDGPAPPLAGIRVVASDMDGTFLAPDHSAPAENMKAVVEAEARGIQVVFATGRSRIAAQGKVPDIDLSRRPGVFLNGAVVYGGSGSLVHERTVPAAVTAEALRFVRDLSDRSERVGVILSYGDLTFAPEPAERWCGHLHKDYEDPVPGSLRGYDAAAAAFDRDSEEGDEAAPKRRRREEPHLVHILANSEDL